MYIMHLYKPREPNPSSKFLQVAKKSRSQLKRAKYLGWTYEITRRQIGVTVKRQQYSVTIWRDLRAFAISLADCCTTDQAQQAAIQWIEHTEQQSRKAHPWQKVHGPHRKVR